MIVVLFGYRNNFYKRAECVHNQALIVIWNVSLFCHWDSSSIFNPSQLKRVFASDSSRTKKNANEYSLLSHYRSLPYPNSTLNDEFFEIQAYLWDVHPSFQTRRWHTPPPDTVSKHYCTVNTHTIKPFTTFLTDPITSNIKWTSLMLHF